MKKIKLFVFRVVLSFVSCFVLVANAATVNYSIKNFKKIRVSGSWNVTINRSKYYSIRLQLPKKLKKNLVVYKDNGALYIELKNTSFFFWGGYKNLRAKITLPNLESVQTSGSVKGTFSGFRGRTLNVRTSGSSNLVGVNNRFHKLKLRASGSSNIDLAKTPVFNAHISLSGASKLSLNMLGGSLTGRTSGSSLITYRGKLNKQDIESSGSSTIEKR